MIGRLSVLVLLAAALWACSPERNYRDVVQAVSDRPVGEITRDISVAQTFVSNHDRLSGIGLLMATWNRTNNCDVVIHLRRDGSTFDIATQRLKCSAIMDNLWLTFDFSPIKDSLGKKFVIVIDSPNGTPGNAVTIWTTASRVYLDGQLSVNGTVLPGALSFMSFHK